MTTRRVNQSSREAVNRTWLQLRHWGPDVSGRSEAVAAIHVLPEDLHFEGARPRPLAGIQTDEDTCYGRRAEPARRHAKSEEYPMTAPLTLWKQTMGSQAHQPESHLYDVHRGSLTMLCTRRPRSISSNRMPGLMHEDDPQQAGARNNATPQHRPAGGAVVWTGMAPAKQ